MVTRNDLWNRHHAGSGLFGAWYHSWGQPEEVDLLRLWLQQLDHMRAELGQRLAELENQGVADGSDTVQEDCTG